MGDLMEGGNEVTRDEFGGYCCKKWGGNSGNSFANSAKFDDFEFEGNICKLLGLDVEKMALELVRGDIEKR